MPALIAPLLVLAWFLSGSMAAAVTVEDLPPHAVYRIAALDIEGVGFFTEREIRNVILSAPPPWWKPWERWLHPVTFNPELFHTALDRIRTRLRESGYYEAQLEYDLLPSEDTIQIEIHIDQGVPAQVRQVTISTIDFSLTSDEEAKLRRLMPIAAEA